MCDVMPRRVYYTWKLLLADVIITRPIIIITNFFLPTKNVMQYVSLLLYLSAAFLYYTARPNAKEVKLIERKKFFFSKNRPPCII